VLLGIAAIVIIAGAIWGVRYYHYSQTHVSTDDATVTGNLVNVSPIIAGTLTKLTVEEGDPVKAGQLIARLDDSGQLAALRQAKAAYAAAETQIPQAQTTLAYQKQATDAAIQKAQAELAAQNAKTSGAQQQVVLSNATVLNQVKQAQSQVRQAQAQASQAQASVQTYRRAITTAQHAAAAAAANISAAQAAYNKAAQDQARYATLVKQEAVTPQQYDAVVAATKSAQAQLNVARQQAAQAQSAVAQAVAQRNAAQEQADAMRQQVNVARAGLGLAQANAGQVGIQQTNVLSSVQQGSQAQADLNAAQAGRQQIALREQQIKTYEAQAAQAKAALANAQITEDDTYIKAPTNGTVVRKAVNVGASLSPGQEIVTITQGNHVWVTANYKETQLSDVRAGQPVEIDVDAFPGKIFQGKVQSVNEASGASTALLPPDNATGNFTKVVQRIPVKIQLIPAPANADKKYARASDIAMLRQGESVTATIDTSGAKG
jgi:membrane fusion protein, multidrug efflux system